MSGAEVGLLSVVLILVLIYSGLYIPVALGLVSFVGVWIIRGNLDHPLNLLAISAQDSISDPTFAVVPLFAFMGLLVSLAGLGRNVYEVANFIFRSLRGGLGLATVAANAVFAAITGSSIASASVFTKVSVPEMRHFGYQARFTVGVVAGSSVLGMLIPPSVMLILYAIITEQSVGHMFIAGVIPGILLAIAFGEPGHERHSRQLERCDRLFSSNLLEAEFLATLAREDVEVDAARFLSPITWVFPDRALTAEFREVLSHGYVRGADLWHLACAVYLNRSVGGMVFSTLDERQRDAARALGIL